jgi:ABC-2 type transport system ATP-binding protein
MSREISVNVNKLTRCFGDFTAVNDISFRVYDGEIFGFLGANGAGKTTTIRMLCGLLLPTSGAATVEGFDIYKETHKIKTIIGYMSQKFSLYDDLTVHENLEFYAGVYGVGKRDIGPKTKAILQEYGLYQQRDKLTREMPLGWKQRLALTCAIIHDPQIVFLDEPTGGVDPISRRHFWETIYDLSEKGTTIFVTTHYMDEAEYCNRISIMHAGKIIDVDSPLEMKKKYNKDSIQDVFIHLVTDQ